MISETPFQLIEKLRSWFFARDGDITLADGKTIVLPGGTDLTGLPFVTTSSTSALSNEKVLTGGTDISVVVGGSTVTINNTASISGVIPVGGIIMWSGSIVSIPSGWALCDGNNGTPNLTDRFVIGAGSTYAVDDTGGAATANLEHSHTSGTLATNSDSHSHSSGTLATDSDGHTHGIGTLNTLGTSASPQAFLQGTGSSGSHDPVGHAHAVTGSTASDSHNHNVTTGSTASDSHSHSVNSGSTGNAGSTTQSILNPYYALAFIMRTS